jgi:hypothetical protein
MTGVRPDNHVADIPAFDPIAPTVFHQGWWLDAASAGQYHEITVESGGRIVGRFPFVLRRAGRLRTVCGMPELTHFLGPAVDDGTGAGCNRAVKRLEITRRLLDKLPKTSGFWHKMHLGTPDMLAFQERAYDISVQFTYEILPAPESILWKSMRDKTRNVVRRAEEQFCLSEVHDPAEFIHPYNANLTSRGDRNIYNNATIGRLFIEARKHRQGKILAARRPDGSIAAAIFYVWDSRVTYYLMSTRANDAGNGAVSLLIWKAICESSSHERMFDFDGIGAHGATHFFSGFGGRVATRFVASKFSPAHTVIGRILHFTRPLRFESALEKPVPAVVSAQKHE